MAFPPPATEESRSPLPAPYEDPWRRLAQDLVAVVAAGSLKAREIWRRNGEGSLVRPPFWPSSRASLFWPSLLGLVLAIALALGLGLGPRLTGWFPGASRGPNPDLFRADQGAPGPSQAKGGADGDRAKAGSNVDGADALGGSLLVVPDGAAAEGSGPSEASVPEPPAGEPAVIEPATSSEVAVPETAGAEIPPLSLSDLVGPDPAGWMLELQERPAEGLLRLRVAGGYGALPLAERQPLAEGWLQRSLELGYERFELVDRQGRLLARPARVGSGMILFDAPTTPP